MVERIKVIDNKFEVQDYIFWHIANIINSLAEADDEDLNEFIPIDVELTSDKYSYCPDALNVVLHALDLLGYEAQKPLFSINLNDDKKKYTYVWSVNLKVDPRKYFCY